MNADTIAAALHVAGAPGLSLLPVRFFAICFEKGR